MTPTRSMLVAAAVGTALLVATGRPVRAAGLDPTFGGDDGIVTTPIGAAAGALAVIVQPDDKIVTAGLGTAGTTAVAVTRYLSSGALDPTFGNGGIVTTPVGAEAVAEGMVRQSDGKLVVAGFTSNGTTRSVLVMRYDDDGTLDATFGAGGVVVTPLAPTAFAQQLALQSDGKIVVAGTVGELDDADIVVLRYDTTGMLDASFDDDGIVVTDLAPPGRDFASSVAVQADDAIVVGGWRTALGGGGGQLALARYTSNGALDAAFGSGGIVLTGPPAFGLDVLVQPDQKIVLGARNNNVIVMRFLPDGTPDTSFATNGTFTAGGFGGNQLVALQTIAYQAPDRLLLAGVVVSVIGIHPPFETSNDVFLQRLIDDGQASDFSKTSDWGSSTDSFTSLATLPDGRIVGAGSVGTALAVVRYETAICGDGTIAGGETCDDGNLTDGDGCDRNCQPTGCGNGVRTSGEACDDHNTADGDCCSSTCQFDAPGVSCSNDTNPCTDDVCNATGSCTHPVDNALPCDDGNGCTLGDTCSGGTCVGTPLVCGLCEACDAATSTCVGGPQATCRDVPPEARASLQIRDMTPDKGDALQWKRTKSLDTTLGDFGAPNLSTQYALCLYDESGPTATLLSKITLRQGMCGTAFCWKSLGGRGWAYRDKSLTPDGADALLLKQAGSGASTLAFKGRGANLPLPALPLPLPARLQLQATNGACWQATYSASGTKRNDAAQFRGVND